MVGVPLLTALVTVLRFLHVVPSPVGFFFDGNWLLFAVGVLVYYGLNYAGSRNSQPAGRAVAVDLRAAGDGAAGRDAPGAPVAAPSGARVP